MLLLQNDLSISPDSAIRDKKEVILPSLYNFFKENNNIDKILPIISGYSNLSIRVLDWFVTNYAKKYNIIYQLKDGTYFNVYLDYKSQLKGYKKKMFDPFCRKRRIPFNYSENKCVITTIGQLNFFRWAIKNEAIKYVMDNLNNITEDMNIGTRKMNNLSDYTTSSDKKKSVNIHSIPFYISLD